MADTPSLSFHVHFMARPSRCGLLRVSAPTRSLFPRVLTSPSLCPFLRCVMIGPLLPHDQVRLAAPQTLQPKARGFLEHHRPTLQARATSNLPCHMPPSPNASGRAAAAFSAPPAGLTPAVPSALEGAAPATSSSIPPRSCVSTPEGSALSFPPIGVGIHNRAKLESPHDPLPETMDEAGMWEDDLDENDAL